MSWHFTTEEHLCFDKESFRDGNYLVYHEKDFNRLLNDDEWQKQNYDEYEFVTDHMDEMRESNDKTFIFIPDTETYLKIECYYLNDN